MHITMYRWLVPNSICEIPNHLSGLCNPLMIDRTDNTLSILSEASQSEAFTNPPDIANLGMETPQETYLV